MARVFLLNAPADEPVRSPLLSFCYLAASLRRAGHEVALLDACAPGAPRDLAEIAERVRAFAPDVVGVRLLTLYARAAYRAVAALRAALPESERPLFVGGGPHATACPAEPLAHGLDLSVRGEAEESLVEIANALDHGEDPARVDGVSSRGLGGMIRHAPKRGFLLDLDALADPLSALDLFEPAWYGATRTVPPVGLLSSRGCPAACTFCSNMVTGRRFRYRSAERVAREVARLRDEHGLRAFSFFDDSFAVGRRRVEELAAAMRRHGRGVSWTCTAHPAHLSRDVLALLREAGCGGVDIGMESAHPEMLLRIGKGVTVARVLDVLGWCRELGLHSVVNLMFGWPDETEEEVRATMEFMELAAPLAGAFNARGVLVPYPGTEIYDRYHARFGFTAWWLAEPELRYPPFPSTWSFSEVKRAYAFDPALERNFFRHPPRVVELIAEGLRRKAELTLGAVARMMAAPPAAAVPAAGAR